MLLTKEVSKGLKVKWFSERYPIHVLQQPPVSLLGSPFMAAKQRDESNITYLMFWVWRWRNVWRDDLFFGKNTWIEKNEKW